MRGEGHPPPLPDWWGKDHLLEKATRGERPCSTPIQLGCLSSKTFGFNLVWLYCGLSQTGRDAGRARDDSAFLLQARSPRRASPGSCAWVPRRPTDRPRRRCLSEAPRPSPHPLRPGRDPTCRCCPPPAGKGKELWPLGAHSVVVPPRAAGAQR